MSATLARVSDRLFLALVALLPLHTVYLYRWVAWKPWLVLMLVIVALDLISGRGLRWRRNGVVAVAVFGLAVLASWPGPGAPMNFWRLGLALGAGALLLQVVGSHATDLDRVLRVVFWSGAAMAVTGILLGLTTNGTFGPGAVDWFNGLPGVDRVNKSAYVIGFVALTNWHQDPGYAALWTNVWFVLAGHAWLRGVVRAPRWVGPVVLGGLATCTVLTLSRTGWFGLICGTVALVVATRKDAARTLRLVGTAAGVSIVLLGVLFAIDRPEVGNDMVRSVWFRIANIVVLGQIEVPEEEVPPGGDPGDNRIDVWSEYWERFLESPVRGTGLGTGWAETDFQEPHNLWLQLIAETGIVGLLGFLAMIVILARGAGRPRAVVGSAMAVVALASLAQTVLFEPVLWFLLGLWHARAGEGDETAPAPTGAAVAGR